MGPTLLAFDTATERVVVALGHRDRLWQACEEGGKASATLLPAIQQLLDAAGIALADLDAIAFGRGPGAFTGLRTACAVAQGLAFGAAKPVVAVDSLLALAEDARRRVGVEAEAAARGWRVWAVADARMGEVYAARYERAGGAWRAVVAPLLAAPAALAARWADDRPDAVAGAAITVFDPLHASGAACRIADAAVSPAALLGVAAEAFAAGAAVDAALALPLYVRDKVALTVAERAAARALS